MARATPTTLMGALGLPVQVERLYDRILRQSGRELISVAEVLTLSSEDLLRQLEPLLERGVVRVEDARVFVETPVEAVTRLLGETAAGAARAQARLHEVAAAIPFLSGNVPRASLGTGPEVKQLDGEVSAGGQPRHLIAELVRTSPGNLCWLRPDQFRPPQGDALAGVIRGVVEDGRRSRAIYPVRALTEAREILTERAALGEEIRVLPQLPTRMLIIGTSVAVLPEPLGYFDEPRTLTRQRGLVEAMIFWFDMMWNRAAPVPALDSDDVRSDLRRFLLQQLASGAQDEQIARRLGVSLRTVRRRVADIMEELAVDTRFQAGVEAVRRGWL
ncbi:LuxR C-terminal-related transcriptional regulator [Nocardioides pantholopis]|uniref:LuxR C-terminal-related transcriptional regulator n=1 Tax=Nocardioides pantholopis TaxID=2483798 RepID=UPI000F08FD74|nr:LuxR C-terminal-related transcriptional regulator [Nocardioides pantholopis]